MRSIFRSSFAPFDRCNGESIVQLPLQESSISGDRSIVRPQSKRAVVGRARRHGLGYAFVLYTPGDLGMIAYGPGHFAAAIQTVDFSLIAQW